MINSSHALVFAMLSTASGWGLPSHDSLHSPNESGVDGPRDRRHTQLYLPQTNSTRNAESLGLSPKLTADRIHGGQLPGIAWRLD